MAAWVAFHRQYQLTNKHSFASCIFYQPSHLCACLPSPIATLIPTVTPHPIIHTPSSTITTIHHTNITTTSPVRVLGLCYGCIRDVRVAGAALDGAHSGVHAGGGVVPRAQAAAQARGGGGQAGGGDLRWGRGGGGCGLGLLQ